MKHTKLILILALILVYFVGVYLRVNSFNLRGHSHGQLFSMESAQHARHAKMVSEKIPIPTQERHLQHPDGYNIHQDTIVEEYLAGWAYRILPFKRVSFDAFLHYFVPLLFWLLCRISF